MMFQVLLILSAVLSIYSVVESSCPDGWTAYNSKCYSLGITDRYWDACKATCESLNAVMLCVTDASTSSWLISHITYPTWIGISRYNDNNRFTWVSGCSSTFTNWGVNVDYPCGVLQPGINKWFTDDYVNNCACELSLDSVVSE
jgi:hypothetical protein